jgi:hypothetical protein
MLRFRLRLSLWLAKHRILRITKQHGVQPKGIWWIGAIDINPRHLVFWVATDRDSERDALLADQSFIRDCLKALAASGYPREAASLAHITAESQQTVDRDFGGNWWYAVK